MTPFQLFLNYCKLKDIMGEMYKLKGLDTSVFYVYDKELERYVYKHRPFKDVFHSKFMTSGFDSAFMVMCSYYGNGFELCRNNPKVAKAMKAWKNFVTKNVILNNPINKDDEIKFILFGSELTGKVVSYSNDFDCFIVNCDGRTRHIRPSDIIEINGKPYEFDFGIRYKRKNYDVK